MNFLNLSDAKFNKIREYRNQKYIREFSLNSNLISKDEHYTYKKLLEQEKDYLAFLILNENKDYGVITLKKETEDTYTIGDYTVKEEYKFEGAGIVNRYCIIYICNKLNIKYLKSEFKINNTRGHRSGLISQVNECVQEDGFFKEIVEVFNFNDEKVTNTKARKIFDKLYEIETCSL